MSGPDGAQEFGGRLRERRLAAGLSLAQLAACIHYSKGHLSRIERGLAVPGPGFTDLCDAVLGPDSEAVPLPSRKSGAKRSATTADAFTDPALAFAVPYRTHSLPPAGRFFVGRRDTLALIESVLEGAETQPVSSDVVCVLSGMAGSGKTAIAVQAAHRIRNAYPDGCLYLSLHGHTRSMPPLTADDALDRLLRLLGMPGECIPQHPEDRAAAYRAAMADKRLLLVLDDAIGSSQVLPLLPGNPRCPVLVTSRTVLNALDDAHRLQIDPLPHEEAVALFAQVAGLVNTPGKGTAGVPAALHRPPLDAAVTLCGHLPLAVRIAATRCATGSSRTVSDLVRRLADEHARLAELTDNERSVTASFAVSFEALDSAERRMFVVLGLHPGSDLDAAAAAALADCGAREGESLLDRLADANLVLRAGLGRFDLHDLLRAFARDLARRLPDPERTAAVHRMTDHYVMLADAASRALAPHRHRLPLGPIPVPEGGLPPTSTYEQALAWFTAEQRTLVELVHASFDERTDVRCWQFAYLLRDFFFVTKQWDSWIASHREALRAAQRLADPRAEAVTANNLGLALIETGDLTGADEHYEQARRLFSVLKDVHGIANALGNHAWIHFYRGEFPQAFDQFSTAFEHYQQAGARRNAAITLRGIGLTEVEMARYDGAVAHLEAALSAFTELDLPLDSAMALNCLGEAHLRRGDMRSAITSLEQAAALSRRCGSRFEEARATRNLARATEAAGDLAAARRNRSRALELYAELGPAGEASLWPPLRYAH
ncbi:ATP-binding protein [Actinomadura luteofluorescens]|uniref:ATP-binding protein n=1 Tax=Actinomadura luteofluorescens TaxID=46163 RepID=UPI0030CC590C